MQIFHGTVIHALEPNAITVLQSAVLGVERGRVVFLENDHTETLTPSSTLTLRGSSSSPAHQYHLRDAELIVVPRHGFIAPGLVDTHTHAPQFTFAGTGYDLQLLEWLQTYTFPFEAKFSELQHAKLVYTKVVQRTLSHGSTSAVYFGTIHADSTLALANAAAVAGQRAFIGKVNMDRNAPEYYIESTASSLAETTRFVAAMRRSLSAEACAAIASGSPAPIPVVTPRFVPTCSAALLKGLGELAAEYALPIQTHISENTDEVAWVAELHPECSSYADTYDAYGLLGERTILAHGVYLTDEELSLIVKRGATVSHCPMSNSMIRSGAMPLRKLLREGVRVALGTDVSGGASPSLLCTVREVIKVSNLVSVTSAHQSKALTLSAETDEATELPAAAEAAAPPAKKLKMQSPKPTQPTESAQPAEPRSAHSPLSPVSTAEAFWLATVGGARALGVEALTGNFGVGSEFDAIVIDPLAAGSPFDLYGADRSHLH